MLVARLVLTGLSLHDAAFWYLVAGAMPFIVVFDFGIGQTAAREIAFARASDRPAREVDDLARTCLTIVALSGIGLLVVGAFAGLISQVCFHVDSGRAWSIAIFCIGTVIKILANGMQGLLIGLQRIASERSVRTCGSLVFLGSAWWCLRQGSGVPGLCVAWLIQAIFCLVTSAIGVTRGGVALLKGRWQTAIAHRLKEPLTQYFLAALPAILIFNVALYVVASVLDARSVVALSLMLQISTGLGLMATLPPSTLTASWSDLWARGLTEDLRKSVLMGFGLVSLSISAAVAVVAVHTDLAVNVLFGKDGLNAGAFVALYLLLALAEALANCLTWAILATGFVRFARVNWISAVIVMALTWPLTHLLGLLGVPLAALLAQFVACYRRNIAIALRLLQAKSLDIRNGVVVATLPITIQVLGQWSLQALIAGVPMPPGARLLMFCVFAAIVSAGLWAFFRRRGALSFRSASS